MYVKGICGEVYFFLFCSNMSNPFGNSTINQYSTYFTIKFGTNVIDYHNIQCTYEFIDTNNTLQEINTTLSQINTSDYNEFKIDSSGEYKFLNGVNYALSFQYNSLSRAIEEKIFFGSPLIPYTDFSSAFLNTIQVFASNPAGDSVFEYDIKIYESDENGTLTTGVPIYSIIVPAETYISEDEPELDGRQCVYVEYYSATVNKYYKVLVIARNSFSSSQPLEENVYTTNYASPPKITNVKYLDQKVRVMFDWPTYSGGGDSQIYGILTVVSSLFSNYQLEPERIVDIDNSTVEINFADLNYGREYQISLYTYNEAGNSEAAVATVIPRITPSSPIIKSVDPRNRQIIITYNVVPNSEICYIQYYITNVSTGKVEGNLMDILAVQGEDATFTIPCVKNNQQYIISYRTINQIGTSPYNYYSTTTYEDLTIYNKLTQRNSLNQTCSLSQKQMYANRIRNPGRMIKQSLRGIM